MTLPAPPDQLADPLAAFYAQDPTVLVQGTPVPPVAIATRPHDRIAWEIAAAVLIAGTAIRHHLASQAPVIGQTAAQARSAWAMFAPTWLRLTVPAVRQAYALGRVQGLTDDELSALATDYAAGIGEYLNTTSAAALEEGFNAQISQRWDAGLAWHRAAAAYGLDSRDMRSYLKAAITDRSVDPVPAIARTMVDKAFLARAERLGTEEAYSATQAGQAVSWLWLERNGRLAPGHAREWEMGENDEHCATCAELASQVVALDQPFVLRSGAKIWAPRAHPRCHCRVRLVPPRAALDKAHYGAAGVAVRAADTGRVLMLQRARDPRDAAGGTWEFPGGCLERGEGYLSAAVREWQEEVRRKLPMGDLGGSWASGTYKGFVWTIPHEAEIQSHRRGRVVNPDDPDGDEIEAIAWWDPEHLKAANPALRAELRQSLPAVRGALSGRTYEVSKTYNPKEARDRRGRWAEVAEQAPAREQAPVKPASPFDAPAPGRFDAVSAFDQVSRFDAAARFDAPAAAPSRGHGAFDSPFHQARAPRPRALVRQVVIVGMPDQPPPHAADPYVMAVDDFHMVAGRAAIGAMYGTGGLVDFNRAEKPPTASSEISAWDALDDDLVIVKKAPAAMTRAELAEHWDQIQQAARLGFNAAFTEADDSIEPLVAKLSGDDLTRIFTMAGYDDERQGSPELAARMAQEDKMRQRIKLAVQHHGAGSSHVDSLAEAYADYVTYADPVRLLGRKTGQPIEDALNEAESAGMDVRSLQHSAVPVEQVFSFEEGFHPQTRLDSFEAKVVSQYSPYMVEYSSALAHYQPGEVPPLFFGLQQLRMMPMVHKRGLADAWVALGHHDAEG